MPATEEDHIPARHLFRGRQWPQGYVFPACAQCNDASTMDELVLGWLMRIRVTDCSAADEAEMEEALAKLNRRRPEWVRQMRELSRIETRRELRQRRLSPEDFPGGEVYIVTMPPEFTDAVARYAQKLGRALYYLHIGRAVPARALVKVKAATNTEYLSPDFPWEKLKIVAGRPVVTRAGRSLEDQFTYRYSVPDDGGGAYFLVQFGESTVMSILVADDEASYHKRVEQRRAAQATAGALPAPPPAV